MHELQVVDRLGETSHSCFEMKGGRLSAAVSRLKACARDSSSPVSEGALCLSEEECPIGEGTGVSWVLCALDAVCTTPMLASSVCR